MCVCKNINNYMGEYIANNHIFYKILRFVDCKICAFCNEHYKKFKKMILVSTVFCFFVFKTTLLFSNIRYREAALLVE